MTKEIKGIITGSILVALCFVGFWITTSSLMPGKPEEIPVLMLYSDTSKTTLYGTDEEGWETTEQGYDQYSYWQEGYKVGDKFTDADGKDLPKGTVIWQYKEIKDAQEK